MAIKQINGEDDYASSSEEKENFIDSKSKFGVKKMKEAAFGEIKLLDAEKVLKAARRVTGAISED